MKFLRKMADAGFSHWLIRIPLMVVFFQQGMDKMPVTVEAAESWDLPYLVWWIVAYGEVGAALGILAGGILNLDMMKSWMKTLGDMLTRFSGITICCIMTGVIWIGQPESVWDVLLYDNLHVMLYFGGLFFALRGNRT
jgi:putative oxidoreductase